MRKIWCKSNTLIYNITNVEIRKGVKYISKSEGKLLLIGSQCISSRTFVSYTTIHTTIHIILKPVDNDVFSFSSRRCTLQTAVATVSLIVVL
jgi:hypothetical protein